MNTRSTKRKTVLLNKEDTEQELKKETPSKRIKSVAKTEQNIQIEDDRSQKRKHDSDEESSSDSSVGDYLKAPEEIDLNSSFFTLNPKSQDFDDLEKKMFSGIQRLSDSDESEDEKYTFETACSSSHTITTNFTQLQNYNEKLEQAKTCIENYKIKKSTKTETNQDINHLLKLGEAKSNVSHEFDSDENLDWEEIEEDSDKEDTINIPKEGVQITVQLPTTVRKKSKGVDMMTSIKRRINRIKKENQVYVHKVHLLCWIAHGNFVNSILNHEILLAQALSLLPSEQCYPPKHADIKYLEQIVRWYGKIVKIQESKQDMSIKDALNLQITQKIATSKRNFVLLFIIILRSLGLQCRLVLSFQCLPLRPPNSELCSLSAKETPKQNVTTNKNVVKSKDCKVSVSTNIKNKLNQSLNKSKSSNTQENNKSSKSKVRNTKKSEEKVNNNTSTSGKSLEITNKTTKSKRNKKYSTISQKTVKISQLDGADDIPTTSKSKSTKKLTLKEKIEKNLDNDFCNLNRNSRRSSNKSIKYSETDSNSNVNKKSKKQLNVRGDIINLLKGEISERRHAEKSKTVRNSSKNKDSDYDSDFAVKPTIKKRSKKSGKTYNFANNIEVNQKVKRRVRPKSEIDNRAISTEEENESEKAKKVGNDVWVEVFLEEEEKWISVDLIKGQVHCISELHSRASQPVSYIVAWNNNLSLKDITARYCPNWNTVTRKLRVDVQWWNETLKPFLGNKTARDKEEDEDLARQQLDKPLPTTINEYKNHPLYALKRHLLKFQAIYPPDAVTLGFVRNEAVYARECVHTLHSREIWVKHAKVVKPNQQPYKIVKARPKYDRLTGNMITDQPLEIFGSWQVEDYVPPTAENGIVPRNAFGNVELFKPCMLPKKTVHLQLPGLNKIARKLGIDCAPAVVGFDFHAGGSHPTFDGYVVCEEFEDVLIVAWEEDREETAKREQDKYEKRVFGNWRKLIKGLLIRERLKARYDFGNPKNSKSSKNKKPRIQDV